MGRSSSQVYACRMCRLSRAAAALAPRHALIHTGPSPACPPSHPWQLDRGARGHSRTVQKVSAAQGGRPWAWRAVFFRQQKAGRPPRMPGCWAGVTSAAHRPPARRQVITSEIDEAIDTNFKVVPGVGNFGDRWVLVWLRVGGHLSGLCCELALPLATVGRRCSPAHCTPAHTPPSPPSPPQIFLRINGGPGGEPGAAAAVAGNAPADPLMPSQPTLNKFVARKSGCQLGLNS